MILLIDVGNTNINIGLVKGRDEIIKDIRLNTNSKNTAADYYMLIKSFINLDLVNQVVISSVVPRITEILTEMTKKHLKTNLLILEAPVKTGIKIIAENPKEVGADLIAAASGVGREGNYLIIDLGTASKFIYLKDTTITGVVISPGVEISLKSLTDNTALLPSVEIRKPKKVLGNQTIECMQSGIYYGTVAYINGMVDLIKKEVNEDFEVILTGGNSNYFTEEDFINITIERQLIFKGLLNIYYKNELFKRV